jgi:small subunit ribosomal protein S3
MEERKFVQFKKEELAMKKYIWGSIGKGRLSGVRVEYTPVGEKIIIATDRPGVVIGPKGAKINELTRVLKTRFKLENPHIEIEEVENINFDSALVADNIALELEKFGNLRFKRIAYKYLTRIIDSGALGVELRLTGKLPSDRARSWRFSSGYLKKVGESSKVVDRAQSTALTKTGIIGIKVAILSPNVKLHDKIEISEELKASINTEVFEETKKKKTSKPKTDKETKEKKTKASKKEEPKAEEVKEKEDKKSKANKEAKEVKENKESKK